MRTIANRHIAVVGLAAVALITAGCGNSKSVDASAPPPASAKATATSTTPAQPTEVKLTGESGIEVTLTGPIAAKYSSATEQQKTALGKPLTGDRNAGTRGKRRGIPAIPGRRDHRQERSGRHARNIILGKIRQAWNVPRGPDGTPAVTGTNGSAGPLGLPTSDVSTIGDLEVPTFEHGKIEYNPATGQVAVTVDGKVVPSGL